MIWSPTAWCCTGLVETGVYHGPGCAAAGGAAAPARAAAGETVVGRGVPWWLAGLLAGWHGRGHACMLALLTCLGCCAHTLLPAHQHPTHSIARPLPPHLRQVGRIWQQFSSLEEGRVQNVIEALPPAGLPLADGASLTLIVEAGWEPRTMRSIALTFRCVCWGRWLGCLVCGRVARTSCGGRGAMTLSGVVWPELPR